MAGERRIFIGDVQGCLDPLLRLLDRLRFDQSSDRLFFTGDLVSKGPDSAGVLRLARGLGAAAVLGNHDVRLLEASAGRRRRKKGFPCPDLLEAEDRADLLAWLEGLPLLIHLGDIVLVHAGIRPGWVDLRARAPQLRARFEAALRGGGSLFGDEDVRFALSARFCTAEGLQALEDWPPPGPPYRNWIDWYRAPETVVFGHFACQGLRIEPRVRGLDTGCVYGGELTAWIAEEDRVVAVPATPRARPR